MSLKRPYPLQFPLTETQIKVLLDRLLIPANFRNLINVEDGSTGDQTAADIRTLGFFDISNDGSGSGLDADLLDGNEASAFASSSALQNVVEDTTPQLGGTLDVNGNNITMTASETVDGRDLSFDGTKLDGIESSSDVTDSTNVNSAGAVMESDYNAQTILQATSNNTPVALTVSEQRLVGRITAGNITGLTAAQVRTLINVEDGSTADQTNAQIKTAYEANADTNEFSDAEQTKLSGIEASADVTDTTNVTAALPISDATSLVHDPTDSTKQVRIDVGTVATATTRILTVPNQDVDLTPASGTFASSAQGTTADAALARSGGQMTGNITMAATETVDGRDLSVDGTKLDAIESSATADQTAGDIRTLGFFDTSNDGTGSGLDSDLLDGNEATAFATSAQGSTADSALQDIVDDTTPQLGANLDTNTFNINFDDAKGILDDSGNEQLIFQKTASAVNQLEITNTATGNAPIFKVEGDDTDISFIIRAKGAGITVVQTPGSANALVVDSNGIITMPIQSAFLAFNSVIDSNVTGNGATATIDFDTEVYDQNADFASDTFTAPVTGKYLLTTQVEISGIVSADFSDFRILTSNRSYLARRHIRFDGNYLASLTVVADMDAADTVTVTMQITGMASDAADIVGNSTFLLTSFSGCLLA